VVDSVSLGEGVIGADVTYGEFQILLGRAHSSIAELAALLGMNQTSITNYKAKGVVPTHLAAVAVLVASLADHGIDFRSSLERINPTPKRARGNNHFGVRRSSESGSGHKKESA
jgi:hypothetical protein